MTDEEERQRQDLPESAPQPTDEEVAEREGPSLLRGLDKALADLTVTTTRLDREAQRITVSTVLNGLACILTTVRVGWVVRYGSINFAFLSGIISATILISVLRYERIRRHGNTLFEEISDELQWQLFQNVSKLGKGQRPSLEVRLALRTYNESAQLPFFGGKRGGQIYALLNISITILAAFIAAFYSLG